MGRTQAAIVVTAAAFLALVVVLHLRSGEPHLPRPAPEFRLPTLAGGEVSLAGLRGRTVLVNFWATWCPPCVEETPALVALDRKLSPLGLVVLGISVDEDRGAVDRFVGQFGLTYEVLLDPSAVTARRFGTRKYPESYLLSPDGQIVQRYVGAIDWMSAGVSGEIARALSPAR